jgi:hypothetical protein
MQNRKEENGGSKSIEGRNRGDRRAAERAKQRGGAVMTSNDGVGSRERLTEASRLLSIWPFHRWMSDFTGVYPSTDHHAVDERK